MADRIARLKALTGEEDVYDASTPAETPVDEEAAPVQYEVRAHNIYEGSDSEEEAAPVQHKVRAHNIYEGSDSEEDMTAIMKAGLNQSQYGTAAPLLFPELGSNDFNEYKLQYGQLAPEGESFCPWKAVTKYPYNYVGHANRPKVTAGFFDDGKCYNQTWDFFYLYRLREDPNQTPILLVPTKQVKYFLAVINRSLGTNLTIPAGAKGVFQIVFNNDGTPYPRYLGRALNRKMADDLREVVPPRYYKLDGEPPVMKPAVNTSLAAFKAKIAAMNLAQKAKKQATKEKQRVERIAKQQSWKHSTKRVQRYLGLRRRTELVDVSAEHAKLEGQGINSNEYDIALRPSLAARESDTFYDPEKPTKFMLEDAVVFICIDVEAYEINNDIVTEIGIATLDVLDIVDMAPGDLGINWRKAIRARHFRIKEHMHLKNSVHVTGCADRFGFGTSEIISSTNAAHIVASCFTHPFSAPDPPPNSTNPLQSDSIDPPPKRNIILVGHDVDADIRFLKLIGYDVTNLNLHECIDTTLMWRALKREPNPRALGFILAELNIVGWNLHNAGNDAVYTLQAMLGIACKYLVEKEEKKKREREVARRVRIAEAVREATETAVACEEGWSSEGSDGGERITPEAAAAKKAAQAAAKAASKRPRNVNALWRNGGPEGAGINAGNEEDKAVGEGEKETGLENVMEKTKLGEVSRMETEMETQMNQSQSRSQSRSQTNPKIPRDIPATLNPWLKGDDRIYREKW